MKHRPMTKQESLTYLLQIFNTLYPIPSQPPSFGLHQILGMADVIQEWSGMNSHEWKLYVEKTKLENT